MVQAVTGGWSTRGRHSQREKLKPLVRATGRLRWDSGQYKNVFLPRKINYKTSVGSHRPTQINVQRIKMNIFWVTFNLYLPLLSLFFGCVGTFFVLKYFYLL
jgi:hypothetical protein